MYIEKAVEAGKVLPAQVDKFVALSLNGDGFEHVKSIIDSAVAQVSFSEQSQKVEVTQEKEDVDSKIRKYMDDKKVDYSTAFDAIARGAN